MNFNDLITSLIQFAQRHSAWGPANLIHQLWEKFIGDEADPAACYFIALGLCLLLGVLAISLISNWSQELLYRWRLHQYHQAVHVVDQQIQNQITKLVNSNATMAPDYFLDLKRQKKLPEFDGVYVLHNEHNNKYYVGQSIHVIKRVSDHFHGYGSPGVFFDYKHGAPFQIALIHLEGSGFSTLNSLERNAINVYHAFDQGYNKTRGNEG